MQQCEFTDDLALMCVSDGILLFFCTNFLQSATALSHLFQSFQFDFHAGGFHILLRIKFFAYCEIYCATTYLPYCTRAFSIILAYFYFFNSTVDLYHVFFFIVSGHFINHFFILTQPVTLFMTNPTTLFPPHLLKSISNIYAKYNLNLFRPRSEKFRKTLGHLGKTHIK